jgi:hypothetical protein
MMLSTSWATFLASRTSWTRTIEAPFFINNVSTASVPSSLSSGGKLNGVPMNDLRE